MIDFFSAFFDDFYDEFYYDLAPAGSDRWIIDFYAGVNQRLGSTLVVTPLTVEGSCLQVTGTSSVLVVGASSGLFGVGSGIIGSTFRIG